MGSESCRTCNDLREWNNADESTLRFDSLNNRNTISTINHPHIIFIENDQQYSWAVFLYLLDGCYIGRRVVCCALIRVVFNTLCAHDDEKGSLADYTMDFLYLELRREVVFFKNIIFTSCPVAVLSNGHP